MVHFPYVQKYCAELQQNLLTTDYPSHIAVFLRRLMLGFLPNKPWTIITFTWRALYFARVRDFVLLVTNARHRHLHLTKSQPHQLVLIKSQPHHLNPNKSQPRQLNLAFFPGKRFCVAGYKSPASSSKILSTLLKRPKGPLHYWLSQPSLRRRKKELRKTKITSGLSS